MKSGVADKKKTRIFRKRTFMQIHKKNLEIFSKNYIDKNIKNVIIVVHSQQIQRSKRGEKHGRRSHKFGSKVRKCL